MKPKYPWCDIIECPICESKTFEYISYYDAMYGIVEQHGYCRRCGYIIEQSYNEPLARNTTNQMGRDTAKRFQPDSLVSWGGRRELIW